jgi:hypothetical protein
MRNSNYLTLPKKKGAGFSRIYTTPILCRLPVANPAQTAQTVLRRTILSLAA